MDSNYESPRWYWIAAIWTGIGLFEATQTVFVMRAEGMHHAWGRLFLSLLLSWLPWALATRWALLLNRRYPIAHWKKASTWLAHSAACLGIGLASTAWTAFLDKLLDPWLNGPATFLHMWMIRFSNSLLAIVILYGTLLLVDAMLESRERLAHQQTETARLNEQLSKAQLSALRRQIEPHFLFNTLNAIAGLIREKRNDDAVSMIAGLSTFLRRVLEDSDRHQVPLGEELEFVQGYLDIQKVRFGDRLQFSVDVPPDLLPQPVPSLILQPMVENAVKHGIARRVQGSEIRIVAARSDRKLTLRVYNDGPLLAAGWETTGSGVGISNIRARLKSLYGDGFEFNLENQEPGGVEASLSVPCKE